MTSLLYEGPPKYPLPPHPVFARCAGPPFFDAPYRFSGVCPFLSVSTLNRSRTACVRLAFLSDGSRLVGGTPGGELVVWGGSSLAFEDLKRLPRSGGAVTALEAELLQDRIYVGDAGGQVACLSLALSPVEADSLMVRREPQGRQELAVSFFVTSEPLPLCCWVCSLYLLASSLLLLFNGR
ncbi:hypothetical protein Efla_005613 [Eimeria flavescens]